jgi:hypothetical protein
MKMNLSTNRIIFVAVFSGLASGLIVVFAGLVFLNLDSPKKSVYQIAYSPTPTRPLFSIPPTPTPSAESTPKPLAPSSEQKSVMGKFLIRTREMLETIVGENSSWEIKSLKTAATLFQPWESGDDRFVVTYTLAQFQEVDAFNHFAELEARVTCKYQFMESFNGGLTGHLYEYVANLEFVDYSAVNLYPYDDAMWVGSRKVGGEGQGILSEPWGHTSCVLDF